MNRRDFLRATGSLSTAPALLSLESCVGGRLPEWGRRTTNPRLFAHGVASGDPLPDQVIIWTRLQSLDSFMSVEWQVAEDPSFRRVAAQGSVAALASRDHAVKVDVKGLHPGLTYYYRFLTSAGNSDVGRTRTAPVGHVDQLNLAVVSCSNYTQGFFNAYARLAERDDLDAVVHLGDYIYETGEVGRIERAHLPPREVYNLADYRQRYAQYRSDPDLQALHQRHPMICVWDDHESANNAWSGGAQNHSAAEGSWPDRKQDAIQAYREWMPIRDPEPVITSERIYRSFYFGDLLKLLMLDTRLVGRDRQLRGMSDRNLASDPELNNPTRTLLGFEQEVWLAEKLRERGQTWTMLAQQVFFGQRKHDAAPNALGGGRSRFGDSWDGYNGARQRIFDQLRNEAINNVCVLTGDVHKSFALDLSDDPNNPLIYQAETGQGALATEFVCTSVSSGGDRDEDWSEEQLNQFQRQNPHIKYQERSKHGYVLLKLDHQRTVAEYWYVGTVHQSDLAHELGVSYTVNSGDNHLSDSLESRDAQKWQ